MTRRAIVFVHSSDELYGADRVLLEVLAAVPERELVEVWLPTDQVQHQLCAELRRRGIEYRHLALPIMRRAYRRPRGLVGLAARTARAVLALRRARPRVVYCTNSAALLAAPAARLARVPRVVAHVQEVWSDGDRRVLGRLAACCHSMIAVSDRAADAVGPRLRARVVVVPNATPDPLPVEPLSGRTGPLSYVVASRWGAGKGHATLLAAWDQLDEPGRLTILGGPPPSGLSVDVPKLVAGLREPKSVCVVGEVEDASSYLDAADVALVPSDYPEGFGLVAIEAFARGRPVVASAAGGLRDIVHSGIDGWLFASSDVAGLAAVLAALDRPAVTAAGLRARDTYERNYTTAAYAERWRRALGADVAAHAVVVPDGN